MATLPDDVASAWVQHYQAKASGEPTSPAGGALQTQVDVVSKLRRRVARKVYHATPTSKKNWDVLRKEAFKVGKDARRQRTHRIWASIYRKLEAIVESELFDHVIAAVVLANGICVACEVDIDPDGSRGYIKRWLDIVELVFGLVFVLEAAAKICVYGLGAMVSKGLHMLELVLAAVSLVDIVTTLLPQLNPYDVGLNVLSIIRLARFARFFKHGELAIISSCFFPAFRTLVHVSCFLMLIIFMFSVPVVRLIGQNPIWHGEGGLPEVPVLYGSMPRASFGLLQMMINPDTALMRELGERQPWTGPFFLVFLGMTTYTTMAIITGSIVDSYNQRAEHERAKLNSFEKVNQAIIRRRLLHEFRVADSKEVTLQGVLSTAEFKRRLSMPVFQDAMKELGLQDDDTSTLMGMLEMDGHIHYEEFIDALGHMGESASVTDILSLRAHVSEDVEKVDTRMKEMGARLDRRLDVIQESLAQLLQK